MPGLISALIFAGAVAGGGSRTEEANVLINVWTKPEACNSSNAQTVDIEELLAAPKRYYGRCVAVEGILSGRALFIDEDDIVTKYPDHNRWRENRRLGLYASDAVWEALHAIRSRTIIKAFGIMGDCKDFQTSNTIMVLGYCHSSAGSILRMSLFEGQ